MKRIKYEFRGFQKTLPYSEKTLQIAQKEADNGKYEIYDDGKPEPVQEPTAIEILNTLLGVST